MLGTGIIMIRVQILYCVSKLYLSYDHSVILLHVIVSQKMYVHKQIFVLHVMTPYTTLLHYVFCLNSFKFIIFKLPYDKQNPIFVVIS